MEQTPSPASASLATKPIDWVRAGQATILAVYDEMVDAAANMTSLLLMHQPQPCYCYVPPSVQRQGNHVWVGL